MWNDLIPVLGIICTIGLPIVAGCILGLQWMKTRHTERMGLINQGIIPPSNSPKEEVTPNRLVSLRNGIVLVGLGIGITVGFFLSQYLTKGMGEALWMTGASVVFFLGLGYLAYFLIAERLPESKAKEEDK